MVVRCCSYDPSSTLKAFLRMIIGVAPEAAVGGNIALVRDGDIITIDADEKSLNVHLSDEELAARRANWTPPKPWYSNGVIAKYAKLVSSSSIGAITDRF